MNAADMSVINGETRYLTVRMRIYTRIPPKMTIEFISTG